MVLRGTKRSVTPYGRAVVFVDFLNRIGCAQAIERHMPSSLNSPNAIRPEETLTSFLISVLAGAGQGRSGPASCPQISSISYDLQILPTHFFLNQASPIKPEPRSSMVAGSGTGCCSLMGMR